MITKWKPTGADEFRTEWQGMRLRLYRVALGSWALEVEAAEGLLSVNDKAQALVGQTWPTSRAALDSIDAVMGRVIANAVVTARQGPMSSERIIHHA